MTPVTGGSGATAAGDGAAVAGRNCTRCGKPPRAFGYCDRWDCGRFPRPPLDGPEVSRELSRDVLDQLELEAQLWALDPFTGSGVSGEAW